MLSQTSLADSPLWHPFADMSTISAGKFAVSRAEDVWLWDTEGKRYLDATASLWSANVGHGRAEIADAVREQILRLDCYLTFGNNTNERAEELARRLAALAPMTDPRVFLTTGGGEAADTAAKLARQYWVRQGMPDRMHIISREEAYHGVNGYGTSIGGIDENRTGWGRLAPDASRVARDSPDALESAIERLGAERVAAFFFEPVQGAGGVHPPKPGYVEAVAETCRRHGVLLVVDSVICGFGRLGDWFGIERWGGVRPDMILFAKGVTSGYLPLGGVVIGAEVAEPFWTQPGKFRHGPTYSGHPTCCAAALANLDILEREGLLSRGLELESELADVLASAGEHPLVAEVRSGTGVLAAIEIDAEARAADPDLVGRLHRHMKEAGVITRPLESCLTISPPLTVRAEQLAEIADALHGALATAEVQDGRDPKTSSRTSSPA